MTLKTGKQCTWEDIVVGEVFAWDGCWIILQKIDKERLMFIADDYSGYTVSKPSRIILWEYWISCCRGNTYKLPKSVQALWKEE